MKKVIFIISTIFCLYTLISCETEDALIPQNNNEIVGGSIDTNNRFFNTKDILRMYRIPGRKTYNNEEKRTIICDQSYPDEVCCNVYYLVPWLDGKNNDEENIVIYSQSNEVCNDLMIPASKIRIDSSHNDIVLVQWQY